MQGNQQRKALLLSLLMFMLAQTAYIESYRGWTTPQLEETLTEPARVSSPAVCGSASRSSGDSIYVDVVEGSNDYPGTISCPLSSLEQAITIAGSESASNPEIILHAGLYHENVSIDNIDNLLIRAADGERVVFDGTRSITDDLGGVWGSADSDGIQEVTLSQDGWQLFLAHEEQVPARWPNAQFSDDTVFNRSYWAEGTLTNSNNAYTIGWLTDAGPEAGVHTGLNETVNATGLDPVGAIAVMNLGSFRTNSRVITDWNPNNGTFAYDGTGVGWKTKHHAYFLEGKRELIDQDGEWWFNNTNNRLHYKTPSSRDANNLDLRVKVQPFAVSVDNSDGVTIQGIDFFGTTVNFNNCDGCSLTNASLQYPSTSKRGLGIAGESEDDRWMTRFYRSTNSFVDNISITNTDGGAIEFHGSGGQSHNNTVNNSYFHAIDWSAADQKGLMTTIYEGGRDMYFTNNSVHLTGASSVLSIGDAPKVYYNEVWDVGYLQTDGAIVQVMQGEAPDAEIAYNWIHDVIKYGARFDAPINEVGEGMNGTMHHNVIWNAAGGLMVKGDYHDIHNNTVFNSTGKNDIIILTDNEVNNGNSTIHQNAADKMADHRSDSWSLYPLPAGTYWNNWNGYVNTTDSVWNQLVDPANQDFRPKVNSHLDNMSAGAYDAGDSNPWTAGISWTYSAPSAPVAGCMLDYADNYDSDATLSDGSCLFASYSPPSTLDLRLHLDPTNSSSYSGSGTNLADLSTYGNDGTIDGAEWEANRTRFYYDGSCSGATAPANQAGTYVCDEVTFAETNDHDPDSNGDWSISVWINATTVQHSVIIGKWNGGGSASDLGYIIRIGSDNKLYTSVGTTSGSYAVSTSRISIDEDRWYHLVMVADVGNMLRLYADGVNVVNASLSGSGSIRNTTSGISIGSYNAGEYNQPFDGNIGEVMIFANALNSTTINQMYNASKGTYSNTTSLSYSDSSYTFVKGQAYNLPLSESNGDLTTSYTLIGSLPSGMNFGSSNGTIWGTPTADMTSTTYTVTANNSAGSFSTTLSMQIMSAPSGVSYSPSSMILEKDTVMTTNTPSYSGSTVTSWSISPALPSGLTFDTSTGAISGTPSVLQTSAQSYAITATNNQGSATTSVSITINDQAPDISYTSPVEISNNREMTTISPANTGGTVTSWVITPSLPTGLSFGSTNGSIWGVPENVTSDVTYSIWANNSGGANSTTLTLSVNWTLTPSIAGVSITRNSSIGTDITWEWGYDPLEASNLTMFATWRNTCAIRDDGDLYCWGRNGNGQLGIGSMGSDTWKTRPTSTNSLGSDAVSVSMGEQHTCAVLDTGVLKCWGRNNHGQVGAGPGGDEDTPQTINVGSGRTATSVYLGYHHTCAILDDQSVKCWGRNQDGELGVGSTTNSFNTPQSISSLGTNRYAVSLALGQGFTCALLDDGSIKCWGQDNLGQRGDGGVYGSDIRSPPSSAITLPTGRTAKQISAGEFHVCALLDDDSVVCWGNNAEGQLGDGTTTHRTAPVNVSSFGSGHTVSYVSAGYDHVCALLTDGGVRCWGSNNNGQLGDGSTTDRSTPPSTDVNLGSGYTAIGISSGGGHTCAMLQDGDMKCWGARGSGQVGDNSALGSNDVLSPVFVQGSRVWEEGDFLTSPAVSGATCAISPALPTGLSLNSGTCAITGMPTVTASNTTYTVWANVSGNSFSGQVWIEVVLNTPNPSYSPSTFTFTKNTSISSINPANTGGEVSSWSISPSLPSGLSFGTINGSIWGTPTSISSTTSYTITATNSAGSSNSAISITVNDIAPSIVYNPNTLTLTRGLTISALDINNTGGAITTCSPSPSLPSGLSISNSCQITGTPSSVLSSTTYTITASNSGGSDSTTITIQVNDVPPNTIIYNPHNMSLVRNTAMSANTPSVSGGSVTTWAISPALPSGLTFSTNSGLISGTPSTLQTTAQLYTVWANNSGGSASTTVNITILEQAPSGLNYNPSALSLTVNTTMTPSNPIVFGGTITSWQISPALPAGLSFGTSNGSIWGAPTSIQSLTTYTIWVNNSGGSNSTSITITVTDQIPTLTYALSTLVLTKGSQSSDLPLNATLNGSGTITSWAISAALPAGLNFGTGNGTIWGIPTVLQTTAVTYTIWANNSGGSSSATVTITINDEAPGPFEYIPENNTWTNNSYVNIGPSFINQTSGNGSTWAVSLPNSNLAMVVGDVVYLNGNKFFGDARFAALNTSNGTAWYPDATWTSGNGQVTATYNHGYHMSYLIGDVIYFDAEGPGGIELWAYNTSNNSGWLVSEINTNTTYPNTNSNPGDHFSALINDTIYFSAGSGNASLGVELWAHDISNGTTWRVGHTNSTGTLPSTNAPTSAGRDLGVIGDTIYFQAWGSGDEGMWAYNTSNTTMWEVDFRSTSRSPNPGKCMAVVVGETLYFDADASTHGRELWAHNHANQTTWMVKDFRTTNYHHQFRDGNPGCLGMSGMVVGDTFYFSATTPYTVGNGELWAHNTSNHSTWVVADIFPGIAGTSVPGDRLAVVIGDAIYFDANDGGSSTQSVRDLWAHDTSNKTTWKVYNFSFADDYIHSDALLLSIGDTLYFVASVNETRGGYFAYGLWAHDTSNQSTWVVEDGSSGFSPYWPGSGQSVFVNGTLYTHISTCTQNCNGLGGYNLLSINYQTNTGGNVTTWAINGSLPSGVTFNTQTGVLSGTPTELWPQTSYMVWANNSGGSSVAYLNITVVDELPTIAYSPTDITLTNNTVSTDLPLVPTITGPGEITSWAINASLPAGLTFEVSNGTIWGTPTELWTQTAYMVWANNSGGSSIAYLNITVVDQLPTISYVPENLTLTNNTASGDLPLAPTINGPGEITSWAINATLPAGLTFGSNNGTIYGISTELWVTTSYTIWANNSGGSSLAYLNITVEDQLPTSLNYIPNGQNATINTAITTMNPSLTGPGQITSWEISPILPQGVNLNSSTGVIAGTPTELWANTTYTIWANNTGGSINTTIWLMVTLPAPNISYNFVNITLTSNVSSINYNATNSGGDIAYGDNVIHGHSDVFCALSEQGQVVCWGDNIDGIARPGASTSTDYSPSIVSMPTGRYATALAVGNEFACALLDNGSVACWGDADGSTALEYWDGDGIIEPTLMPGLGGTSIAIDIDAGFAHACVILSNLSAMCWGTNAWDNLGINSNSLSTTPAHVSVIPSGRTIIDITAGHTHTCALLDNASVYCWGDNQRGQIGVGYTSSSIANGAYAQLDGKQVSVLEAGRDSTCVAFTGGGASCWGKNRDGMLGDGTTIDRSSPVEVQGLGDNDSISSFELSFDTTCIITTENIAICWGDETGNANGASTSPVEVDFPANRYAISIALDYDSGCAILDDGSVSCWGSGSDRNFGNNTTSYSDTPVSGVTQITHRANVGGYRIRGALPQGIQFSASNGTIWGMPTEVVSQFVNYSVTVYNSAGSSTYSFSILVIDLLPTISYNPENLTFTNNTAHPDLPLAPNITGAGSITSWEISPSLPSGLNFGSENGTLWGVPTQLLNLTTFTVYANNSGGSSTATINMTIVDQVPVLIYNPSNITLTRGEQSDVLPLQPNLSGPGDVLTWEISPTLPNGIQFGSDNGTIWGIPTVNMTQTSFTIWANNSGGQTNFTINITILEPVAIFDYQPENLTLVRNETMTSLHPLITGGNPLTWEISPTLPSGLSFSDGVISGTPAVNSSTVMYTVWANNSGGSANHTINITILEPTGDLFYNPENLTLIRNQSMTTLNPIFTGGSVDNWSIFPALPSGLLFNNGLISGTPLVNSTTVMYTIWANNSGGVATATINITILEPIVNLSYNPENITLIRNQSMNTLYPTVTGGVVSEWSIYPSLPLGLNFTNGVISGTPEVNMTTTMYAIYANTSAGSTFANINITILEPVVNLSFQPTEIILIRNSSMTPISAVVSGGSVATWEISPQLPSGLTFIDGILNGTPLVNMTRSEFTIYANTSGGSANFSINITILETAPQISINPQNITLMRYEQMDAVSAEIIGDGMPENWSIHPDLPEGLFFENGTIYGTPAENLTRSTFIIWANNSGGSTSIPFDIEILEPLPNISYSPENYTLTRGLDNVTINPISTGGMVANWSIYPELPQGMSFENGSISGISIVESLNVTYVITAVNSGGSAVAYLNISVVEQLPELSIDVNLSLVRYGEPANLTVNNSGGNASTWEIHPELPDGLSFVDGVLTGVAQVNSTETVYTVWANNSGGSASASFSLQINEPSPDISYQTESYVVVYDATEVLIIPINTGGVPETWEISPQLPQGLQFGNGVISGIATEEMNQTNYTVWANNSLGSSMTSFTLEVNYPVFFARYEKTRIVLEVNETMMPLVPIYYFGPSQSPTWSISDELPEGMKFNNGVISGAPQHPLNETEYTITVTGEMAPVELSVVIHVLGDWPQNATVVNETIEQPEPESPNEPELNFVIPLIFLLLLFVAALVGGNIFLAAIADDDEEEEEEDSENENGSQENEG